MKTFVLLGVGVFLIVLSAFSSAATACPETHESVMEGCVVPGNPGDKGFVSIAEFQMACMDQNKMASHAQPLADDEGTVVCDKFSQRWECCVLSLESE